MEHTPVLLHETIQGLDLEPGNVVVDATLGLGGHSEGILEHIGAEGTLIGIDLDENALDHARERLAALPGNKRFMRGNFRDIESLVTPLNVGTLDAALFDLGWNSTQLEAGRGLSFLKDEPLVMTLANNPEEGAVTAEHVVNEWSEADLKETILTLGEERFAGRIVRAIVDARREERITRSKQLSDIIVAAVPEWYRRKKIHPSTRTFQAIRIVVNDELTNITTGVRAAYDMLAPHGRIAVITFHSLEDGLVKRLFRELAREKGAHVVTKKPLVPTREELLENPRARSAKLRILEHE